MSRKIIKYCLAAILIFTLLLVLMTLLFIKPVTGAFSRVLSDTKTLIVNDRNGTPLSVSYQSDWNTTHHIPLYQMPEFLVQSFVFSEDRNFYTHNGVDWSARFSALRQNIKNGKTVRGASTITEQVVRMINPRPRTLWSKWLEGVESILLESHAQKSDILEFYLNQIPYASHRRGVAQAARHYFDRDLDTLTPKEILSLAVLARAPSAYDLYKDSSKINGAVERLSSQMLLNNVIDNAIYDDLLIQKIQTSPSSLLVDARHFTRHVFVDEDNDATKDNIVATTLDASLQSQIQGIIDQRIKKLSSKNVHNSGVLVMDYTTGEILSWVAAGAMDKSTKGGDIDPITTPRQPGSTLKPFLYAAALEKDWDAGTFLNDAPIAEAVGNGLHRFKNYSNTHYGILTLREALGNSLNIPAILTINYVGVENFLNMLHKLGFESLSLDAGIYDEGLALGNGEVTLFELVGAYATLANKGRYTPLHVRMNDKKIKKSVFVFTPETSSIIGNILSDSSARSLEFGHDSILNLPYSTATKTGTSTDYRDAWAVGYNDKYVVGIWMGNLDRTPMKEVTGSTGPGLALRSIFSLLNKGRDVKPIYQSPSLLTDTICTRPMNDNRECPKRTEIFASLPEETYAPFNKKNKIELVRPTNGLMVAYDPRIPSSHQKFRFELAGIEQGSEVEWILNDLPLTRSPLSTYLWDVAKGTHTLAVNIYDVNGDKKTLPAVTFTVR